MVGSKQDIYDLCQINGFHDTFRIIKQLYSYRKQIEMLEFILLDYISLNDEEMIKDLKDEIKFYKNILKRFKECYLKRINTLIEQNYDQEIIDKFMAICNETFYIETKNIHFENEDYIVNYEELKETNKVKIKKMLEVAKKEEL